MTDRADEAVGVALETGERAPKHFVRRAIAVNVRRHKRADAALVSVLHDRDETFLAEFLAEVHEASAAPGAVSCACQFHKVVKEYCCARAAGGTGGEY
jgi:hypothetical protein